MRTVIHVADELEMPDKRGACVIAGMTLRQEADFWIPGNHADPCFKADPGRFRHDSLGNDGKSVGPYQQQTSGPPPAAQWGWGGLYGDPEGTRKRMDPYESSKLFLAALKKRPYRATNAREAGDWAQDVQKSGVPDAYDDDWAFANALYDRVKGNAPAPPPPPQTYGMPRGSDSGGYGNNGVRFPDWVYALGNAFGLLPSTYRGHQESNRNEAGYAPNPQLLNRGIDWAAPGAPDEVVRMQRFADYLATIPQHLEQVIWRNPHTKRSIEVAGGRHQPGYFGGTTLGQHENHVHTRQSKPIPLPGGVVPLPVPNPQRPTLAFEEHYMFNGRNNSSPRSRPPMNFFIHTEEGNGTAKSLAEYCQGQNGVSYHYTLRDGIVYYVVDTDYYSWSVLSANVFSINLCFAGSRAGMSREEWLRRERDIEIAAFLAVQDCKKYGFSTEVLIPRYDQRGSEVYAGNPRSGISDHNYVTRELGIGNHTDVGVNFPWDVFARYVNKYANAATPGDDDEMSAADVARLERKIDTLLNEWGPEKMGPSRAFLATDGKPVESPLGFLYNIDGNVWCQQLTWAYLFHVPLAIEVVETVAATGAYEGSWVESESFNEWLNEFGQAYCQGLMSFKKAIIAALREGPAAPALNGVGLGVYEEQVASNEALRRENAALRVELTRAEAAAKEAKVASALPVPAPEVAGVLVEQDGKTAGGHAADVLDSQIAWNEKLMGMNPAELAALDSALKALKPPTNQDGGQK